MTEEITIRTYQDNPGEEMWAPSDGMHWNSYVQKTRSKYITRYVHFAKQNTNNFPGLEADLANLLNVIDHAWEQNDYETILAMAEWLWCSGGRFLDLRALLSDGIKLLTHAVVAAEKLGRKKQQGQLLGQLARTQTAQQEWTAATGYFEQALAIAREVDDFPAEAAHLGNLGQIELQLGHANEAARNFQDAIKLARKVDDRKMEGRLLASMGLLKLVVQERKPIIEGIEYFRKAIEIAIETNDKQGKASHLGCLGRSYELLGILNLTLPQFVYAPDGTDDTERMVRYRADLENANKESFYMAHGYYSDAYGISNKIQDQLMAERFRADMYRVASIGHLPIHSSGGINQNIWYRNPLPIQLSTAHHWDLEPHLVKALLPSKRT